MPIHSIGDEGAERCSWRDCYLLPEVTLFLQCRRLHLHISIESETPLGAERAERRSIPKRYSLHLAEELIDSVVHRLAADVLEANDALGVDDVDSRPA